MAERKMYSVRLAHTGAGSTDMPLKSIDGTTLPLSAVNLEFRIAVNAEAENELVAHYLVNQACRDLLKRIDDDGLARVAAQTETIELAQTAGML